MLIGLDENILSYELRRASVSESYLPMRLLLHEIVRVQQAHLPR